MPYITTDLDRALYDLRQGLPVAIPTETVYGLAAQVDNEAAIRAVFAMKNRPLDHPLIVHVAQAWDISTMVQDIPAYAQRLIAHFWPGPLTLVLTAKEHALSPLVTGGQPTVAIRSPAHPLAQQVLSKLNAPLVAPSANPFGKISPTTALHVQQSFPNTALTVLEGGRCTVGIESTIVDATHPNHYQVLRHGSIDANAITAVAGVDWIAQEHTLRVPGKLAQHYQPQKKLYYFQEYANLAAFCEQQAAVYAIASKRPLGVSLDNFYALGHTPQRQAFDLFFQLRKADASNAQCIAIELPADTSAWQGVRERIMKAGSMPTSLPART